MTTDVEPTEDTEQDCGHLVPEGDRECVLCGAVVPPEEED